MKWASCHFLITVVTSVEIHHSLRFILKIVLWNYYIILLIFHLSENLFNEKTTRNHISTLCTWPLISMIWLIWINIFWQNVLCDYLTSYIILFLLFWNILIKIINWWYELWSFVFNWCTISSVHISPPSNFSCLWSSISYDWF